MGPIITRKRFLQLGLTAAAGVLSRATFALTSSKDAVDVGVCAGVEKGEIARKAGCAFMEEGVGKILMPDKPDEAFADHLGILHATNAPGIRSFIYFLPGQLKAVGPDANHDAIVEYAVVAFARAAKTGASFVVFGSGNSRRVPEGFSHEAAMAQFIELCARLAPEAARHNIILAVEQLNRSETNFINTLAQAGEVVLAVSHPNFKMTCDIYHALKEEESPDEIMKFGDHIVHCHIAEKDKRTPPGVMGDDFIPWFRALKKARYQGGISLECNWTDFDREIGPAVNVINEQWRRA